MSPYEEAFNERRAQDAYNAAFAAGAASRDGEIASVWEKYGLEKKLRKDADEELEALRAELDTLSHAVHEIHHARHNPNWFTNGKYAAIQHERLWIDRAAEMVKNRSAAIAAEVEAP